jgi:hypothetical protein
MTEFNLSEHQCNGEDILHAECFAYSEENVKEFIRLVKAELTNRLHEVQRFKGVSAEAIKFVTECQIRINALAGDRLK